MTQPGHSRPACRRHGRKTRLVIKMLVCSAFWLSAASADAADSKWQWRLAPMYLWGIELGGDVAVGPVQMPISVKLSDIFDSLEGVFTANFKGVYDNRWGFQMDFAWIDISAPLGPINVDFEYIQGEIDGFYRVPIGRQHIDWLVGARYYSQEFGVSGLSMPGPQSVSIKETWVDPVVGARWGAPMGEKWRVLLRGDIGGFGVGSDLSWQAIAVVDFKPWKHVSIDGGFRALGVDYEAGSGLKRYKYDATVWGPILGFSLHW